MADPGLWRKNLPPDFDGRHGENWDDEIEIKPILWTTVSIVLAVLIAFVFCWWLLRVFDGYRPAPQRSPIAEANERPVLPKPWLQPKPEMELEHMREQLAERMAGYGWSDQLEGMVHIPVDEAMEIVLESAGGAAHSVEPAADEPVDVETTDPETTDPETTDPESADPETAEGDAVH